MALQRVDHTEWEALQQNHLEKLALLRQAQETSGFKFKEVAASPFAIMSSNKNH